MKKSASSVSKKLPLKRESIRSLSHLKLEQVVAGTVGGAPVFDTGDHCDLHLVSPPKG
jgi:hypothetical protein